MGAKLTSDTSVNCSTHKEARDWLAHHVGTNTGSMINIQMYERNLGTHLCLTKSWCNNTGKARLRKATNTTRKAMKLPVQYTAKRTVVISNILPMALYGWEAADMPDKEMAQLRIAIVNANSDGSNHWFNYLTFTNSSDGADLEPNLQTFVTRVTAVRRLTAKIPNAIRQMRRISRIYHDRGQKGHMLRCGSTRCPRTGTATGGKRQKGLEAI